MIRKNYIFPGVIFLLIAGMQILQAQKDQVSLDPLLERNSERMLIKIGMISKSKPAKLKFGPYVTDNRMGRTEITDTSGTRDKEIKSSSVSLFSFDLINTENQKARIEASSSTDLKSDSSNETGSNEVTVYISTSLDEDELWVLLITKPESGGDYSLKNVILTNGTDEITFANISGEPIGKSEFTAPRGIEAYLNDRAIGALQYYSGGSFSYKKFIWIAADSSPQLKLVTASVFAAIMEIGNYFEDTRFTD